MTAAAALLGLGAEMACSTLITMMPDAAHPAMRARALSAYRFWRDFGYAVGALASGASADLFGFAPAILAIVAPSLASGGTAAAMMRGQA
jgi:hypothetical protein